MLGDFLKLSFPFYDPSILHLPTSLTTYIPKLIFYHLEYWIMDHEKRWTIKKWYQKVKQRRRIRRKNIPSKFRLVSKQFQIKYWMTLILTFSMKGKKRNVSLVSRDYSQYFSPIHEVDSKIDYLHCHNHIGFINILSSNPFSHTVSLLLKLFLPLTIVFGRYAM